MFPFAWTIVKNIHHGFKLIVPNVKCQRGLRNAVMWCSWSTCICDLLGGCAPPMVPLQTMIHYYVSYILIIFIIAFSGIARKCVQNPTSNRQYNRTRNCWSNIYQAKCVIWPEKSHQALLWSKCLNTSSPLSPERHINIPATFYINISTKN